MSRWLFVYVLLELAYVALWIAGVIEWWLPLELALGFASGAGVAAFGRLVVQLQLEAKGHAT